MREQEARALRGVGRGQDPSTTTTATTTTTSKKKSMKIILLHEVNASQPGTSRQEQNGGYHSSPLMIMVDCISDGCNKQQCHRIRARHWQAYKLRSVPKAVYKICNKG